MHPQPPPEGSVHTRYAWPAEHAPGPPSFKLAGHVHSPPSPFDELFEVDDEQPPAANAANAATTHKARKVMMEG